MTIVKLKGGLGNQMFQYATGLSVALHQEDELALDLTEFDRNIPHTTPRSFVLSEFNISQTKTAAFESSSSSKLISKIKNKFFPNAAYEYDPAIFASTDLNGYFQNEKYFENIHTQLMKEFTLKNPSTKFNETKKYISSVAGVSMHVRHGDYLTDSKTNKAHGVLSLDYYKEAYATLVKKIGADFTLFIFTDDIAWVKKNITFHSDIYIISGNDFTPAEELLLMSECIHNIIANSSFSWWGAWLNQYLDKIVIAPHQWTTKNTNSHKNIVPTSWITI